MAGYNLWLNGTYGKRELMVR